MSEPKHESPAAQPPADARDDCIERELFRAWCRGDQRKGAVLLRRLRARLLCYFRHAPELAEDLAHDTLLAFVESRHALRSEGALLAFLHRIARRTLIRSLYREKRPVSYPVEPGASCEGVDAIDLSSIDIRRLLCSVPTRDTRTVAEHYLGGWTTPEIARARQVEVRAVRNQLRNGLAQLRRSVVASTTTDVHR